MHSNTWYQAFFLRICMFMSFTVAHLAERLHVDPKMVSKRTVSDRSYIFFHGELLTGLGFLHIAKDPDRAGHRYSRYWQL